MLSILISCVFQEAHNVGIMNVRDVECKKDFVNKVRPCVSDQIGVSPVSKTVCLPIHQNVETETAHFGRTVNFTNYKTPTAKKLNNSRHFASAESFMDDSLTDEMLQDICTPAAINKSPGSKVNSATPGATQFTLTQAVNFCDMTMNESFTVHNSAAIKTNICERRSSTELKTLDSKHGSSDVSAASGGFVERLDASKTGRESDFNNSLPNKLEKTLVDEARFDIGFDFDSDDDEGDEDDIIPPSPLKGRPASHLSFSLNSTKETLPRLQTGADRSDGTILFVYGFICFNKNYSISVMRY